MFAMRTSCPSPMIWQLKQHITSHILHCTYIIIVVMNAFKYCYILHLQLYSGEHARLAFSHLQFVQSPLQEHLISSLHALDISGIVIQTGCHDCVEEVLVQAKSYGDGITCT